MKISNHTPRQNLDKITVKLMARMPDSNTIRHFRRQLPDAEPVWGRCRFVFDRESDYDWLVIYHDLLGHTQTPGQEILRCPRSRTILITAEPSTITVYGTDYLRQFGTIITSQEPWVIKHPNPIFTQTGQMWFYGFPFAEGEVTTYDQLITAAPPEKKRLISTVCSTRRGGITDHSLRVHFTERLKAVMPELDIYGHGVKPMSDKAEALDPYQYHIAVENHVCPHGLTEKLPDAFLGYTLPFYHGCPNASDYFPPESFIPIDINDPAKAEAIIKSVIANNEYPDRLPYIIESRRRVLEDLNIFALLERYITQNPEGTSNNHTPPRATTAGKGEVIMSRRILRRRKPAVAARSLWEKIAVKGRHLLVKNLTAPRRSSSGDGD